MNVELLKEYKETHGHTNVKNKDSKTLSRWCQSICYSFSQRQRGIKPHTQLTDERMQLLREVGFDFGETNTDKSDAVVDVAHEHADDKNEEFSHQPVMNAHSKKLAAVSQSESDAISFPAMTKKEQQQKERDAKFKMKVERLKEFKEKHGHTNVTFKFDVPLTKWCSDVRRGTVRMTEVREQWLREVGFDFGEDKQRKIYIETRRQSARINERERSAQSINNDGLVESADVAIGNHQQECCLCGHFADAVNIF
jgi:hypothetical protein